MSEVTKTPEFKKSYPFIFSYFYLVQGLYNGLQNIVLPVYLISVVDNIDLGLILVIIAIGTLPWALKFLIGMVNDKYGSEKFGRRKPFIFIFGIWGGIWFIISGIYLPMQLDMEATALLTLVGFLALMWNIGWAVADTALDGLIIDVTPKERLGKVQGSTWSMNLFGSTALGIGMGALIFIFDLFTFFFILEGVLFISAVILPFYVKESKIPEEVHVWRDFRHIIGKKKNLKVFFSSLLENVPAAVVTLAFALLIIVYWPETLVEVEITSISIATESIDLLVVFAIFGAIGGIGIIAGCIITGRIADKSRRKSIFFAYIVYVPSIIFAFLFCGAFFGGIVAIILSIIMTILIGVGDGALTTSLQSVRGDLAKQYPDLNSTYYAIVISCLNAGQTGGLLISGALLIILSGIFTEFWIIFLIIMLVMASFKIISLIIFLTIDRSEYEFKHLLEEGAKK